MGSLPGTGSTAKRPGLVLLSVMTHIASLLLSLNPTLRAGKVIPFRGRAGVGYSLASVVCSRKYLQIFKAIIRVISVDMIYMLGLLQLAAQMFLHHVAAPKDSGLRPVGVVDAVVGAARQHTCSVRVWA